jgi:hypothetical protein
MKKELIAVFCVFTMLAGTAPIFAADVSTNKTVVLTPNQLTKLTTAQTQLTALIASIDTLKLTYNNTTKAKGLLIALNQYKKQANKLNTAITNYIKNPTAPAKAKINTFQKHTKALQWKVTVTEKVLKKIKPVHPVHPVKITHPIHPVHPVTPVTNHTATA